MATTKVDNDLGRLLTRDLNERLGREKGEVALANHPPARKVGGKRVTSRKTKEPVVQLPCAVCVGLPEIYAKVTKKCEPGKTYKGLSKHKYETLPLYHTVGALLTMVLWQRAC
jgi:hypothetical protein